MKSKVTQNKIKEFQPITVEITIESMGELKDMLMRMDISKYNLEKHFNYNDEYKDNVTSQSLAHNLWEELRSIYKANL